MPTLAATLVDRFIQSRSVLSKMILVESNLSHANFTGVYMSTAFLNYAEMDNNLKKLVDVVILFGPNIFYSSVLLWCGLLTYVDRTLHHMGFLF